MTYQNSMFQMVDFISIISRFQKTLFFFQTLFVLIHLEFMHLHCVLINNIFQIQHWNRQTNIQHHMILPIHVYHYGIKIPKNNININTVSTSPSYQPVYSYILHPNSLFTSWYYINIKLHHPLPGLKWFVVEDRG